MALFIDPNPDLALLVLRLALGILFLAHGPAKLQRSKEMAQGMGMSANAVLGVGLLETLGALSLILGMYTQVGALFLIAVMLGAIYFKTQKWNKSFTGENGWELDFIILAAALTVFLTSPASYSIL